MDFKTIEKPLNKWANKYEGWSSLEKDELINEVWLCPNMHKEINPKYLSAQIHYNMLDIIRRKTSHRRKYKPNFVPLSAFDFEPGKGVVDYNLNLVDQADTFTYYTKGLSSVAKAIIFKKFCANFTQREIAKNLGMTQSNVSYIMTSALMQMYKKGRLK